MVTTVVLLQYAKFVTEVVLRQRTIEGGELLDGFAREDMLEAQKVVISVDETDPKENDPSFSI